MPYHGRVVGTFNHRTKAMLPVIAALRDLGYGLREIAKCTGLHRETIRAHVAEVSISEALVKYHARRKREGRPVFPPWHRKRLAAQQNQEPQMKSQTTVSIKDVFDKPGAWNSLSPDIKAALTNIVPISAGNGKKVLSQHTVSHGYKSPHKNGQTAANKLDVPVPYVPVKMLPARLRDHAIDNKLSYAARVITPADAQRLLENSATRNRSLSKLVVKRLATAMTQKRWVFTGEPIILTAKGDVLDGQHRLSAVVQSGIETSFFVVQGVDEASLKHMNTGRKRTMGDILSIVVGTTHAQAVASTLTHYMILNQKGFAKTAGSSEEYLRLYKKYSDHVHWAIRVIGQKIHGAGLSISSGCGPVWGAFAIMHQIDADRVERFATRFVNGEINSQTDNALVLRKLVQNAANKGSGEARRDMFGHALFILYTECKRKQVTRSDVVARSSSVFEQLSTELGKL